MLKTYAMVTEIWAEQSRITLILVNHNDGMYIHDALLFTQIELIAKEHFLCHLKETIN